jgi:hypothetical protein
MRNAIGIGMLGLVLFSTRAIAQTAAEQAQILRVFDHSVVLYAERYQCLTMFPEAINAAIPAPKIFTLPVAMVFRQLIARAPASHAPDDFRRQLAVTLPPLPAPLEYRVVHNDLVIRDADADLVVAVLRDAVGSSTRQR